MYHNTEVTFKINQSDFVTVFSFNYWTRNLGVQDTVQEALTVTIIVAQNDHLDDDLLSPLNFKISSYYYGTTFGTALILTVGGGYEMVIELSAVQFGLKSYL